MVLSSLLVAALVVLGSVVAAPSALSDNAEESNDIYHANHIFNAIHSSMRQWGSSWYHNGMSFFLATVPKDTLLYHGSHSAEPVHGTEWLAFEPEHALLFTSSWIPRDPMKSTDQAPFTFEKSTQQGWLHTYAAAKDLRLLYIDGLSAGKTGMGTLDTQNRILFNDTITQPYRDSQRAEVACRLFRDDWDDRIDGIIRMEAGFEIISCDFARDLRSVRVTRAKAYDERDEMLRPGTTSNDLFRLYKVIASRFGGIGGGRVRLNYDHFVTAYEYDLDLFQNGTRHLPRLANLPTESLYPIKRDLRNMVMTHDPCEGSVNWQAITDIIVDRYANDLKSFVSDKFPNLQNLQFEIERILRPFIDFDARDSLAEIHRCKTQFLPDSLPNNTLAARAINEVSHVICSTLITTLHENNYDMVIERLEHLIDYLSWTVWNECPQKCDYNEACFIPIWPAGTVEDREHPQCKDRPSTGGESYWDRRPGRSGF